MEVWSPCTTGAHRRNATRRSTRHCWANGLPAWRFSITTAVRPASRIGSALNASDARLPVIAVAAMGGGAAPGEVARGPAASAGPGKASGTSLGDAVELGPDGRADAVVSAGNSGAFLAIALVRLRTIPGIARPAIAAAIPT